MITTKAKNIAVSSAILLALICVLFLLSKMNEGHSDPISPLYFWAKGTSLLSIIGAFILLALRIFRFIDKNKNFLYSFFATANSLLGIIGVCLFAAHRINTVGLHNLLLNLLLGVVLFADLFVF